MALIERASVVVEDPADQPPVGSSDPEDDYLIALAASTRSLLVTGDSDLLALSGRIPVLTPSGFAGQLSAPG
jgi:predicted nucleic acid-binding protein